MSPLFMCICVVAGVSSFDAHTALEWAVHEGHIREDGYIAMDRYGTVTLLEKGAEIANRIYERHTVLTKMLEGLGVPSDIARADACKMEHDISPESFERIKQHLKDKGEIR